MKAIEPFIVNGNIIRVMGALLAKAATARTREIPGARDAEQWAEELDQSSPDGELSRRT